MWPKKPPQRRVEKTEALEPRTKPKRSEGSQNARSQRVQETAIGFRSWGARARIEGRPEEQLHAHLAATSSRVPGEHEHARLATRVSSTRSYVPAKCARNTSEANSRTSRSSSSHWTISALRAANMLTNSVQEILDCP